MNLNDYLKPKDKPKYDSKGLRIETEEERRNWSEI